MNNAKEADQTSITKPASKVMLAGVLSLLGGLISNVIVAAIFGAGADMDAYLTALVIPTYFQTVFYSSLSFVLVPAFIEAQARNEEHDAWALVGTFIRITTVVLVGISIISSLFSAEIISVSAPGFQKEKAELASQMLSVLMFTVPFAGLGTLTVGVQNARNRFFWPAVAPAVGTFGNVIILLVFYPIVGSMALAWGYLVSIIMQAGFTTLPVMSHGWNKVLPITNHRVVSVMRLMLPLVLFGIVNSFSPVAERFFSSTLPDGQIAYMGYVHKLASIFVVLLASGIASSIFPSMARAYAEGGIEALSEKNTFGLRLSFAVALPSVMIISAIAVPMISVFFERGAFEHADTIGASLILFPFFLRDIFFRMVGNVFQRSFYVLKDATTQLSVTTIFVLLYIATAGFFVARWGYVGLVWAATIKRGLAILVVWMLLSRKFPKTQQWSITSYLLKYGSAAVAAYLCGRSIVWALASVPVFLQLVAGGLAGALLYLTILYCIDSEILKAMTDLSGIRFVIGKLQSSRKSLSPRGL